MTLALAERMSKIKPSATMAVNSKAQELERQGKKIINLSVGEPDFDTPAPIKAAAIEAIEAGFTKYTEAEGILSLREAVAKKLQQDNHLEYAADQIIISDGVKQALYNLCQVLLDQGDEAIIPAPYWVSYPAMVRLASAEPVFIRSTFEQHFKITPEQLKAAITPKTRLLFLNSPSNPSGMAYSAEELKALGQVLKEYPNIIIASDDIYEYILWQKNYVNLLNVCPELKSRVVVLNGLSKSHAMTGWRIGYAAGPLEIINAMKKIQSQSTSNPNSIAQKAALAALMQDRSSLQPMFDAFKQRHDHVYAALSQMQLIRVHPSDGTFYLFFDATAVIEKLALDDDIALANYLLDTAGIATVPGTAFGMPNFLRISCATSLENLDAALQEFTRIFN